MEEKYYTPDLEEFYVGFGCEFFNNMQDKVWKKEICNVDTISMAYDSYEHGDKAFDDAFEDTFRVKYLDSGDIESLGYWEDYDDCEGNVWYRHNTNPKPRICFCERLPFNIWVCDDSERSLDDTLFKGHIKNISELKFILKAIGCE